MVVCRPRSRGRCTYTARDEPAFQRLGALLRRWYKSMQAGCDLDRYDACPKHLTLPSLNLPIHRCRSLSASTTVAVHNKLPARIAGRSTHAARPSWHRIPATLCFCLPWPLRRWISLPRGQNNPTCPHLNSRHWQCQQRKRALQLAQEKTLHKRTT